MSPEPDPLSSGIEHPRDWTNRLCVALDIPDPGQCELMALQVAPAAGGLKIGLQSFAAGGPDLVLRIRKHAPVFLDLKLHDIPAQVASAVSAIARMNVDLTTVHAAGGRAMLGAAVDAAGGDVRVLAVTVLTSLDEADLHATGVTGSAGDQVLRLAEVALTAGVHGLVCSPREVASLRSEFGAAERGGPLLVVPGIRPQGSETGDQKRTTGPAEAIAAGADVIVVGRPITAAPDPHAAAREIAEAAR